MEKDENFCYKGIYYVFKDNVWTLFDKYYPNGNVKRYGANFYRLDECINDFIPYHILLDITIKQSNALFLKELKKL